ncbi:hypothetical protein N0V88_001737 [Collariella sp. IMI 366227]|nr:hypothetical protein N0V88_001737 [Collariella sp. IMI 366227]
MSAPSSPPTGEDDGVRVVTALHNGRQATVVRDTAGNIIYPSYVPPATQSPSSAELRDHIQPPAAGPSPHREKVEPEAASDAVFLDLHDPRPTPPSPKRRETEPLQQSESIPPALRRAGTSASAMDQAARAADDYSSSSSSDSSSDEEDSQPAKIRKKQRKPKGKKKDVDNDDRYRRFRIGNEHYRSKGKVSKRDGRLAISLRDTSNTGYLAKALGTAARKMAPLAEKLTTDQHEQPPPQHPRPQANNNSL